jgi:hypothetical protein
MFDEARDAYVLALAANSGAADATWRKGNEAFISYGALSNARLLLLYGFSSLTADGAITHGDSAKPAAAGDEDQSATVEVYVPLPKDLVDADLKRSVLEGAGLGECAAGEAPFVLRRNSADVLPDALLGTLRVHRAEGVDEATRLKQVTLPCIVEIF